MLQATYRSDFSVPSNLPGISSVERLEFALSLGNSDKEITNEIEARTKEFVAKTPCLAGLLPQSQEIQIGELTAHFSDALPLNIKAKLWYEGVLPKTPPLSRAELQALVAWTLDSAVVRVYQSSGAGVFDFELWVAFLLEFSQKDSLSCGSHDPP